jgi:hypothetical protein
LLWTVADAFAAGGFAAPPDLGAGAALGAFGTGHLAAADFAPVDFEAAGLAPCDRAAGALAGRGAGFFATGARPLGRLAGAAFFVGAREGALLAGFFFAAATFFVIVTFFLAATALLLAGLGLRGAGLAVGRACSLFAAGVFAVFLAAGFFTGSPRNGAATFSRRARRQGAANFGRGGL